MPSRSNLRSERAQRRRQQRQMQQIALGVVAVVIIALLAINLWPRGSGSEGAGDPLGLSEAPATVTASGLQIQDDVVGTGAEATTGSTVSVHYTGWLTDGTKFDSSVDRGTPFEFTIGAGGVIDGWEEGVAGMRVGGTRILTIPPDLGYGANDYGPIPGGSTLIFQIELLDVK